jgi:predicted homoserine dehydrogenase-like protein
MIVRGIGGFDVRGEAVKLADELDHVPIGLLRNTVLKRPVEPGQLITFDDIEVQPSRVLDIIFQQQQKMLQQVQTKAEPAMLCQALP